MRNKTTIIIITFFLTFSLYLNSQTCPNNLTFYKQNASSGSHICVKFSNDPGIETIVHNGITLTRTAGTNEYKNSTGNCNGNSVPNAAKSFTIGSLTCSYSSSGVLPVNFVSFEYKLDLEHVKLRWETASEINNDYFSIERMTEDGSFVEIGKINGNGVSNKERLYQFIDRKPLNGINYYRLKQLDFDGRFSYSKMLSVPLYRDIYFSQNPEMINVEFHGLATFSLYDITGKLIEKQTFKDQMDYDISEFKSKGMFVGTLVTDGNQISQKLFVF